MKRKQIVGKEQCHRQRDRMKICPGKNIRGQVCPFYKAVSEKDVWCNCCEVCRQQCKDNI